MYDFKKGDRVRLIATSDPYTWLRAGAEGTVSLVREDPWGEVVSVAWDDGSRLSMIAADGDLIELV